jgi:hypothetical protein
MRKAGKPPASADAEVLFDTKMHPLTEKRTVEGEPRAALNFVEEQGIHYLVTMGVRLPGLRVMMQKRRVVAN